MNNTDLLTRLLPNGIDSLENLSKTWPENKRTTEFLKHYDGYGDMFGGSGLFVHVIIHGENSYMRVPGTMEIRGWGHNTYNIARGANGPTASTARYYKNDKVGDVTTDANMNVSVEGSCGADTALAAVLGIKFDFNKI